jgi:nucleoside-diphosphate-sugar epimerase
MASRILITGAAGNLGSLLSRHLSARGRQLRPMYHRTPLPPDMLAAPHVQAVSADLADPATRLLFARTVRSQTTPVVLRFGMIYGRGILMVEAARWLARRRLLCVWKEPTLFQLLSTADFLRASEAAIARAGIQGIYHVGDEQPVTVQQFLDEACGCGDIRLRRACRTRSSARQPRCANWARRSREHHRP